MACVTRFLDGNSLITVMAAIFSQFPLPVTPHAPQANRKPLLVCLKRLYRHLGWRLVHSHWLWWVWWVHGGHSWI